MHELSIAMSLVELACEEANRLGDVDVGVLHVRIGRLAGVVPEPLVFSFDVAKQGTPLSGARLQIEEVAVTAWCPQCAAERELADVQSRRCPACHALATEIRRGHELELFAIEVTDAPQDR